MQIKIIKRRFLINNSVFLGICFYFICLLFSKRNINPFIKFPTLWKRYDELVETFLEKLRKGEEFNIYPFVTEVDAVSKGIRRIYGCGSGLGFASVDIKGNIYPCMRFIGNEEYIIGHVETGFNEKRQ